MTQQDIIIGIDEAGRGPFAGPVYVGLVVARTDFDFNQFPALTDSKQMTETDREEIYDQILEGDYKKIDYTIRHSTSQIIDKKGINPAISQAINRGLRNLDISKDNTKLLLDGGLSAPSKYKQESITKGDAKVPTISLASVLAKVARDRYMKSIDEKYDFEFAQHKGYGTKEHRERIEEFGPADIHRETYLTSI